MIDWLKSETWREVCLSQIAHRSNSDEEVVRQKGQHDAHIEEGFGGRLKGMRVRERERDRERERERERESEREHLVHDRISVTVRVDDKVEVGERAGAYVDRVDQQIGQLLAERVHPTEKKTQLSIRCWLIIDFPRWLRYPTSS